MNALQQAIEKQAETQAIVDTIQARLEQVLAVNDSNTAALQQALDAANLNLSEQAYIIADLRNQLSETDTAALALVDRIEATNADLASTLPAAPTPVPAEEPAPAVGVEPQGSPADQPASEIPADQIQPGESLAEFKARTSGDSPSA